MARLVDSMKILVTAYTKCGKEFFLGTLDCRRKKLTDDYYAAQKLNIHNDTKRPIEVVKLSLENERGYLCDVGIRDHIIIGPGLHSTFSWDMERPVVKVSYT